MALFYSFSPPSSLEKMTDLVAVWDVALSDGIHKIEFEHGTTSGKRVVYVDGKVGKNLLPCEIYAEKLGFVLFVDSGFFLNSGYLYVSGLYHFAVKSKLIIIIEVIERNT